MDWLSASMTFSVLSSLNTMQTRAILMVGTTAVRTTEVSDGCSIIELLQATPRFYKHLSIEKSKRHCKNECILFFHSSVCCLPSSSRLSEALSKMV